MHSLDDKYFWKIYALLTKLVRLLRWLDIGQVLFCFFMDPDEVEVHKNAERRTWPIYSHLDRTSLVNKEFIKWPKGYTKFLVTFKINRSKLIFLHLTLLDACNNQCFIHIFIL